MGTCNMDTGRTLGVRTDPVAPTAVMGSEGPISPRYNDGMSCDPPGSTSRLPSNSPPLSRASLVGQLPGTRALSWKFKGLWAKPTTDDHQPFTQDVRILSDRGYHNLLQAIGDLPPPSLPRTPSLPNHPVNRLHLSLLFHPYPFFSSRHHPFSQRVVDTNRLCARYYSSYPLPLSSQTLARLLKVNANL